MRSRTLDDNARYRPQVAVLGKKILNKFFGKDKEFVIEPINGDTVLNMQNSVDLKDHFTFNGVPLIPGKTLKFKLNAETNKYEVYTKFGQFVQPLIDTSTGSTLLLDMPLNDTRNLREQSRVENVNQEIDFEIGVPMFQIKIAAMQRMAVIGGQNSGRRLVMNMGTSPLNIQPHKAKMVISFEMNFCRSHIPVLCSLQCL